MNIPFTIEQFLDVFRNYNMGVWPAQLLLYVLAIGTIIFVFRRTVLSNKIIAGGLFILWFWMGFVYHILYFSTINKSAGLFGALFILQAFLFFYVGIIRHALSFRYSTIGYPFIGLVFVTYALVLYPILGHFLGHTYPRAPTFGVPCPITIFTFGLLLWTDQRMPKYLLIVPLLWSIIGLSAAVNLRIYEDLGLIFAGIMSVVLIVLRDHRLKIQMTFDK